MTEEFNPFVSVGYISKEYFCNRDNELDILKRRIENNTHTTLISERRLGKSALIYRLFDEFPATKYACIYIDVYATNNLKEFTETLSTAILERFPEKKAIGKRFLDFLKGFRPVISYDDLTGKPEIRFEYALPKEYERTIAGILRFLDEQKMKTILGIDEFQQVANYPEKNTEAVLRTIIQTLKNVVFIFSGSNKHLINEIFNNAKRPFFSSTLMLPLYAIPEKVYHDFIKQKMLSGKRKITDEAIQFILTWTRCHTYYTQVVCKEIFSKKKKEIELDFVKEICHEILLSQQYTYNQYRKLLTELQWKLLIAIAKEGEVANPQSAVFLQKYKLGAASSVKRALATLIDKEMVYSLDDSKSSQYKVYDVFLSRYLEKT